MVPEMKCTNCGKKVPDTAKVCGNCGHRLKARATRRAELSQEQGQITPVAVRSVVPGWAWGFMGLLLGIIVIGGLILAGVIPVNLPAFKQLAPIPTSTPFEFASVSDFEGSCPASG